MYNILKKTKGSNNIDFGNFGHKGKNIKLRFLELEEERIKGKIDNFIFTCLGAITATAILALRHRS